MCCKHQLSGWLGVVQIDTVVGDRTPGLEDIKQLRFTTRVINEAMRLYPQPPVLIRRAVEDDVLGGFSVAAGSDIFISVWNIHRSPLCSLPLSEREACMRAGCSRRQSGLSARSLRNACKKLQGEVEAESDCQCT